MTLCYSREMEVKTLERIQRRQCRSKMKNNAEGIKIQRPHDLGFKSEGAFSLGHSGRTSSSGGTVLTTGTTH